MDVATLGIKIENGDVIKASRSLDGLEVASAKSEAATQRLTRRMALLEIEARKMDAEMRRGNRSLTGMMQAMGMTEGAANALKATLGAVSLTAAAGFIGHKMIEETIAAQDAMAQLQAAVDSTGGAAGRTVEQMDALSAELQRMSTFDDEAIKGAEALLLSFTKIQGVQFDDATRAVVDLATRMGGDLKGAALQVGKALQDPATGLTALRRSGVSFTEEQQNVIKALFDTGHQAEAQRMILAELEKEYGGSAAAARNTLGGALVALKNAFGDLFEVSKGGSQGSVDAINSITHALENSAVTMNSFILNTVTGWNNIKAVVEIAKNAMTRDLFKNWDEETRRIEKLNAAVTKARDDANAAAMHPAAAMRRGGGTTGGIATDVLVAAQAARAAQDAARMKAEQDAERAAREQQRTAEEAARHAADYAADMNAIMEKGVADMVDSVSHGMQAMLESISTFSKQALDRMAKEGESNARLGQVGAAAAGGLAGYGMGSHTTNTALGGLGGAAAGAMAGSAFGPMGAAIGGLTGFVGGLFGATNAAKQAAEQLKTLWNEAGKAALAFHDQTKHLDSFETAKAAIDKDYKALWSSLLAGNGGKLPAGLHDVPEGLRMAQSRTSVFQQAIDDYTKLIDLAAKAAALQLQQTNEDYHVRLLSAQGHDKEAAALKLQLDQQREMAALVNSFGETTDSTEETTRKLLEQVQAQEKLKAATDAASKSAYNMVEGYNLQRLVFEHTSPFSLPSTMTGTTGGGFSPSAPRPTPTPTSGPSLSTSASDDSGDLHITIQMDGGKVGTAVLTNFKRRAQQQYGDTTRWGEIQ